jgi:hypothetical protein
MSISELVLLQKKGVVPPVTTELDEVISDSKFVLPRNQEK